MSPDPSSGRHSGDPITEDSATAKDGTPLLRPALPSLEKAQSLMSETFGRCRELGASEEDALAAGLRAASTCLLPDYGWRDVMASRIADALEKCDWSDTPIGNKVLLKGAIDALRQGSLHHHDPRLEAIAAIFSEFHDFVREDLLSGLGAPEREPGAGRGGLSTEDVDEICGIATGAIARLVEIAGAAEQPDPADGYGSDVDRERSRSPERGAAGAQEATAAETPAGARENRPYWEDHPDFPVEDWQYQVANGDTRRGYHEWVDAELEMMREEAGQDNATGPCP